jgi:hypothetical protein
VIIVSWASRVLFRPVYRLIALQMRCTRFFDGFVPTIFRRLRVGLAIFFRVR